MSVFYFITKTVSLQLDQIEDWFWEGGGTELQEAGTSEPDHSNCLGNMIVQIYRANSKMEITQIFLLRGGSISPIEQHHLLNCPLNIVSPHGV